MSELRYNLKIDGDLDVTTAAVVRLRDLIEVRNPSFKLNDFIGFLLIPVGKVRCEIVLLNGWLCLWLSRAWRGYTRTFVNICSGKIKMEVRTRVMESDCDLFLQKGSAVREVVLWPINTGHHAECPCAESSDDVPEYEVVRQRAVNLGRVLVERHS